jgi:hypothetical protein
MRTWSLGHRARATAEERIRGLKVRAAVGAHAPAAMSEVSGSNMRTGGTEAGDARTDVKAGHGMPNIEDFMDEVVADYRRRLALLGDSGDRRAVEDGIALLTDYRPSNMDVAHFEMLLSMLRAGRSPAGLTLLRPEIIGAELSRRWQQYRAAAPQAAAIN